MLARAPPPPLRQSSSAQAVASTSSARVSSSTKHLAPIPSAPLLPLSRSASDPTSTHDRKSRAREPSSPHARVPPPTKKPSDRAKLTELWGSPPKTVKRPDGDIITRGALLGEGGFARVYLATEPEGGKKAIKVVSKEQVKSSKTKAKLFGEIKIHLAMQHQNIISFNQCWEDDGNVYMQLELCSNGTLLDMLRKRKRYTEPEARFYIVQLIGACEYMHNASVIHRDLKLGNLMLDENMNLRVGDFGLAALVKYPGERKKTICGTPNYIAPEILFDTTNGHSFEVDIWSIGVILYTLLVGKPPFQTKDVKNIYRKIKENSYEFPADIDLSVEAVELIQSILTTSPDQRPSLNDILADPWFLSGPFPPSILTTSLTHIPDYRQISIRAAHRNFRAVKKSCGIVDVELPTAPVVSTVELPLRSKPLPALLEEDEVDTGVIPVPTVAVVIATEKEARGMEKEVREALQPGSPICELLRSARKPLMVSPLGEPRELLQRKLLADARLASAAPQPVFTTIASSRAASVPKSQTQSSSSSRGQKENNEGPMTKENDGAKGKERRCESSKSNVLCPTGMGQSVAASTEPISSTRSRYPARELYDSTYRALENALTLSTTAQLQALPNPFPLEAPKVFITCWVDYTHKYGTAYSLTDGSAGLYFNDSTTMVLAPDKVHFDYISNRSGNVYARRHYRMKDHPNELERKAYLLAYFEDYMSQTLLREVDWNFVDKDRIQNMDFLVKYYRMKNAIVFKMSNEVLQFNFYDHTKLLLTQNGTVITFINNTFEMKTYSLFTLFHEASRLGYYRSKPDPHQDPKRKVRLEAIRLLIEKVEYCREVMKGLSERRAVVAVAVAVATQANT